MRHRFEVNFGQREAWFGPPMPGFVFIDHMPLQNRVRGMLSPPRKADCEVSAPCCAVLLSHRLGSVVVRRWTCNQQVAGSTPGHRIAE